MLSNMLLDVEETINEVVQNVADEMRGDSEKNDVL